MSFTNEQRSELLSQRRENQLNEMALDKAPTDHGETTQPFRRMSAQMPRISPSFRTRTRNPDMPLRYSTVRGRAFGEGMRAAIARSGMTGRELADVLGWQEAKVSDMVNGKGGVILQDVLLVLGACRVPEPERERLLDLFPGRELDGWWQPHGKCMPIRPLTARTQLAAAESLVSWHPHAIPDLLQTTDHARAWLAASATVPATEVDERLRTLHELQELLRNGVDCTFYIHEFALALQVGGHEVHATQLCRLMLTASWKRVKVLIVPAAAGVHAGIAGPFTQLKFPKYQPLIWTTTENSSLFVEEKSAVEGYESILQALSKISLDQEESTACLSRLCVRIQEASGAEHVNDEGEDEPFPPI
ncbi:helix-turn-helix domain-containing protein [Lentzea sp. NBC_00516]|uniref:helix-turn-helix domain-containing protein n=1 Tax=Lentzea sp. NBC_00516 TaxID=2903582 RepID=UPI002E7FFCCE|nr:helix-turn-helix transcriptional regulator [Lentzea sp. NBC_00516]WUD26484.1 helix-turn-helix domain-containing protein [Lentzea sp. NBC_00516]